MSRRKVNPRSLVNLSPQARLIGKQRLNLTVLPKTAHWLKKRGNASDLVDQMVDLASKGIFSPTALREIELIKTQNKVLETKLNFLQYKLKVLEEKIKKKEFGYRFNNFAEGIKELKEILK
jgi:hypothetical protein